MNSNTYNSTIKHRNPREHIHFSDNNMERYFFKNDPANKYLAGRKSRKSRKSKKNRKSRKSTLFI